LSVQLLVDNFARHRASASVSVSISRWEFILAAPGTLAYASSELALIALVQSDRRISRAGLPANSSKASPAQPSDLAISEGQLAPS
jgi:hypothetical protein